MPPTSIPEPEGENEAIQDVPITAPLISQNEEGPETLPYRISFARYNRKECQMDGMTGHNAKATLTILRDIGIYFTSEKDYWANADGIEIKPIVRDGEYTCLYRGLGEDAEIKEIKFQHKYKGVDIRLFFFSLEKEKTFYLIAARQTHFDIEKGNKKNKNRKHS